MNGFDVRRLYGSSADGITPVSDLSRADMNAMVARAHAERSAYVTDGVHRAIAALFRRPRHGMGAVTATPRRA